MSTIRTQFDATLEITVGSTKVMRIIVEDPDTGAPLSLIDTDIYNTGNVVIAKPDKTIIATIPIAYVDRPNGAVEFTVTAATTVIANAGNWKGTVQFINFSSLIIDQRVFNFNILA